MRYETSIIDVPRKHTQEDLILEGISNQMGELNPNKQKWAESKLSKHLKEN